MFATARRYRFCSSYTRSQHQRGFCYASLQAEGKEVLPFTFSLQSTGSSLWFHWMWLNARLFNELESMLECIHYRARKLLSDTSLARAEVNKMTDFFRRLSRLG